MKKTISYLILLVVLSVGANANNIRVNTAVLNGQNIPGEFTFVSFNMLWDNSWRTSSGPNNWDAAWVFVKYRIESGPGCTVTGNWLPATLSNVNGDHSVTTNNGVAPAFAAAADNTGVFAYRAADGTGNINWGDVRLRWNYGVDGLASGCVVTIKVFAVEMVHVPSGSFFVGDGSVTFSGQLRNGPTNTAYQITGEGAVTLGGLTAGSLNNSNGSQTVADDFNNVTTQTLPATFPKGFAAFYSMKYEISAEQYAEFLNVLTVTQQLARHAATVVNRYINNGATPPNRNAVKCSILPTGGTPGTYGSDLNNNNIYNETADGQNIAITNLSSQDILAYYDWAGLRPMTELELEKMARGNLPAVPNEYAWGSATLYATPYAALTNSGAGNELPNSPSTTLGNANYSLTNVGIGGPFRVGIFATATSSRVAAGASYYGIMELTGNAWEMPVGLGHVAGRSFTGLHGNGNISATGFANVDNWPGANGNSSWTTSNAGVNAGSTQAAGMMFRGGSWVQLNWLRVSDRNYSSWPGLNARENRIGGRAVRTAP